MASFSSVSMCAIFVDAKMWRFIEGVDNPSRKRKLDEVDKRERDQKYDNESRKRDFLEPWKVNRKWLSFDKTKNAMFCTICCERATTGGGTGSKTDQTSNFVTGCRNFRLESVTAHEKSELHTRSVGIEAAKMAKVGTTAAAKLMETLNKHVFARLTVLFRNAHALAKTRRPFTDFTWLCELDEKKGTDIGTTYRSDKQAQTFTHFIAQQSRDEMSERLKATPFISLISDGTQDHAFMEQEIVFLRSVKAGRVTVDFVSVEHVEKADATGIYNALNAAMGRVGFEKEDWTKKLVGFGSDGAAVMSGKKGGVIAKLKADQPLVQGVHCHAHRLELAFKDALGKQPLYIKLDTLLSVLYLFYRNSSLNRSMLKRTFDALRKKHIMPTRVGGTRWLPHVLRAVENLWKAYPAIVMHMQEVNIFNYN